MEWSKLKNIIILILLAANLFLLTMAGVQRRNFTRYQEQAVQDVLTVLERNGITVAPEVIPEQMSLDSMTVLRERQLEEDLAHALLGEGTLSDLGGGRYSYESPVGSAEFRSNGNFSITFSAGLDLTDAMQDEAAHALTLSAAIGLNSIVAERIPSDNGGTAVVLYQTWQGIPVYSCRITAEYRDGALWAVSGQRLMGEPQPTGAQEELLSIPSVLMRGLNGIHDMGDICSEITRLTPGYQMTNPVEGTRMEPVWYIETDTGAYQLNAITGILERAQTG